MSCLYIAIGNLLKINHREIRQKICDYLSAGNNLIDGLETKDILNIEDKNYVKNMRRQSTWGGAIEIAAACNIWNCRINVINIRERPNKIIEFNPSVSVIEKTLTLKWTGSHYTHVNIS